MFRDGSGRYGYCDSHSRTAEGFPHPTDDGTAVMLTFTGLNDSADYFRFFRIVVLSLATNPCLFHLKWNSLRNHAHYQHVSPSQVTSSLPKTQTNAKVRIHENLVLTDDKNQSVIKVLITNKRRRRKEVRKIANRNHEARLEKTAPHFEVREQKRREYERETYATNLQFRKKKMEGSQKKHDQDPFARFKKMEYMAKRYNNDVLFQKKKERVLN